MKFIHLVIALLVSSTLGYSVEKPNVVMILADDQGWGDLNMLGERGLLTLRATDIPDNEVIDVRYIILTRNEQKK